MGFHVLFIIFRGKDSWEGEGEWVFLGRLNRLIDWSWVCVWGLIVCLFACYGKSDRRHHHHHLPPTPSGLQSLIF